MDIRLFKAQKSFAIVIFLFSAFPLAAQGINAIEREILQELFCAREPKPTRIINELIEMGKIDMEENIGYDSKSCWRLTSELKVAGISFVSVCANDEDEFTRSLNPGLYFRAPGTSPGTLISFGSSASADELASWYLELFGPRLISAAISGGSGSFSTSLGDPSEVECNRWMAPS